MNSFCESMKRDRMRAAESSGGYSSHVIYRLIESVISENGLRGTVLDYGAGTGELTRRLLGMPAFDRVAAADIMSVPSDLLERVEWIEHDLNAPIPNHDCQFEVVVAAEIIEHLENPRAVVRDIFRLLRPGGSAIISTPNNESWRALLSLLIRGHFVAFTEKSYPAHITPLLRQDLSRIFLESRFTTPRFYFTDHGGLPGMPRVTWQNVTFGALRGVRFSDNIIALVRKESDYGPPM
jgi:2-polyprenyl-3-methyl-5-hydroxy-6-metoxy-1,4-benzoquinol methylase